MGENIHIPEEFRNMYSTDECNLMPERVIVSHDENSHRPVYIDFITLNGHDYAHDYPDVHIRVYTTNCFPTQYTYIDIDDANNLEVVLNVVIDVNRHLDDLIWDGKKIKFVDMENTP